MADFSQSAVKRYQKMFKVYDRDNSGSIDATELLLAMRDLGHDLTEAELYDVIEEVDGDGDGEVDFEEFLCLMNTRIKYIKSEQNLKDAFEILDYKGQGYFNENELQHILSSLGPCYDKIDLKKLVKFIDKDKDGKVSLRDFLKVLQ